MLLTDQNCSLQKRRHITDRCRTSTVYRGIFYILHVNNMHWTRGIHGYWPSKLIFAQTVSHISHFSVVLAAVTALICFLVDDIQEWIFDTEQ